MCGIAGLVEFGRPAADLGDVVRVMTETMAARGPDGQGVWAGEHAAMGNRRNSVIDVEGGGQPIVARDETGRELAVIAYVGEVYNFRELRAELAAAGHRFDSHSDTEVVLRAYVEWGTAFAAKLDGIFAFAIWDVAAQELVMVRDRVGIKPLYYYPTPTGVLFGSEPKAILAHPDAAPVVDLDGLRALMVFAQHPGVAPFRGMFEVKPGHLVRFTRAGRTEECYWRLEARPHTEDLPTTVHTIRGMLEEIVTSQMVSDVPLGALLSGGLDSSVIAALAQRSLDQAGGDRLRSFALDFVGHTERFRPERFRTTPDAPYVRDMVARLATEHRDIVLSADDLADPEVRRLVLRAWDLPYNFADSDTSLYLLCRDVKRDVTVALSGESSDEIFAGYPWFHDQAAVRADTFPWLAFGIEVSSGPSLFDADLVGRLRLPDYTGDVYRAAMAEVPRLAGEDGLERRMREVVFLAVTRFVPMLLNRMDRMSMASALEVRVPYLDHRLIEYVYNTPWAMKSFDGREKSLLRAAGADLLPESVRDRVKANFPLIQHERYGLALRRGLGQLLDEDAPVLELLDRGVVKDVAGRPDDVPADQAERAQTEMVLRTDLWLKDYGVQLLDA
jgi:asparagine synthase (glutamine-hydrolysing)